MVESTSDAVRVIATDVASSRPLALTLSVIGRSKTEIMPIDLDTGVLLSVPSVVTNSNSRARVLGDSLVL